MSIICCAAGRFISDCSPLIGSGMSPKCTAAVCASDKTKAAKLIPCGSCCCSGWSVIANPDASIRVLMEIPNPKSQTPNPNTDETVGEKFERLLEIMRALRAPGGCPWDREQTL